MTYRDSSPAWVDAALAKLAAMPRYSYRLDATERVGRYALWWHGVYAQGHGLVIATTNWERYALTVRRCCALHATVGENTDIPLVKKTNVTNIEYQRSQGAKIISEERISRCSTLQHSKPVVPHKPAGVALTVTGTSRQGHA